MRIWSLHPRYLDPQGLVALWREGLLAKKVLEGHTRGYKNHPQLNRFRADPDPLERINGYLHIVCDEADARGYRFDRAKLLPCKPGSKIMKVTRGQMEYEWTHLLKKLFKRSRKIYMKHKSIEKPEAHPVFKIVAGDIEEWEILEPGKPGREQRSPARGKTKAHV